MSEEMTNVSVLSEKKPPLLQIAKRKQLILILDNLFKQTMNFYSHKILQERIIRCQKIVKGLKSNRYVQLALTMRAFFWFIYRNRQSSEVARLFYNVLLRFDGKMLFGPRSALA